jgi:ABC-type branched-subunit amino acid transport system substrate-binding protein
VSGPRRAPRPTPALLLALIVATALLGLGPAHAAPPARVTVPRTLAEADSLVDTVPTPARDKALVEWAKHAPLNDVAWMLDRGSLRLGGAELPMLDVAFAATPSSRPGLRQRWLARRALRGARPPKRGEVPMPDLSALRPGASVFRLAVILPDEGEYAEYGRAVRAALAAGLAYDRPAGARPLTLDSLGTADGDPPRVAAAFDSAAVRSDIIVGELLSQPTLSLATAATATGMTLVSPTATDERIGRVGPSIFQVGPGPEARARALAEAVLGREPHAVAVVGSAAGIHGAFAQAFVAEVTARGGRLARREAARTGGSEVTQQAQSLKASGADVLFWDGATRDIEALVRALATEGASLRVCGGPILAPDALRASVRPLLEGVTWVAEDWKLDARSRAFVDSAAAVAHSRAGSLWTRGFLAGRAIAGAIDEGARCAPEVALLLRNRDATLAAAGALECERDGATLPVFVVQRGKVVSVTAAGSQ